MYLNIFSTWDFNLANNGGSFQFERGSTTWKIFAQRESKHNQNVAKQNTTSFNQPDLLMT